MTVKLPLDLESRVAQKARAEGISPEAYVERVVREATAAEARIPLPLPIWPGHSLSNLRREELYDDVR